MVNNNCIINQNQNQNKLNYNLEKIFIETKTGIGYMCVENHMSTCHQLIRQVQLIRTDEKKEYNIIKDEKYKKKKNPVTSFFVVVVVTEINIFFFLAV